MSVRVSVIVPNYNHRAYLGERLRSVYEQDIADMEVILLDDGSTDGSQDLLEQYRSDPRTSTVVVNQSNSGNPFHQWKKGVELAQGEFIWIAESDDLCSHDLLSSLLPAFDDREVVLAYCRSEKIDSFGNSLGLDTWGKELDAHHWSEDHVVDGLTELSTYLVYKNTLVNASSIVFRKSAFPVGRDFPDHLRYTGDWLIWSQIVIKGKIYFHHRPLNLFREHGNTVRALDNTAVEIEKLKETYGVIRSLQALCPSSTEVVVSRYDWFVERWASRLSWRMFFNFIFVPMSGAMLMRYYRFLWQRIILMMKSRFETKPVEESL